ncbi:MAG: hypothetical protein A3H59_00200 [Candidatus Jacksonbacteria bacterium RIFCSPLOWO2_02_FULL_43_9]|nr:MAG: hypothetical protein UV70_C0011G0077 [Parcubacteria group bacterium GW2011_GWA2_43_13]OGY69718.1 MAG: hypothetical protein A3B94_00315 [Candidatus Jacksonbacteria bacterium RIFCSPHIGHO2_02_FULL_43_10]OGY71449.1 MAG: hypothetical protein A2986_03845 [Candidatus Jacksonbacteria bacterium RIFCSPLOWO2_01_FULL_44_13]OGY72110.1 MAG: hypothetical protein A3H59_00200 [Candidatus Jacksonbacteria bacterium RIFCSPLOWO2_02_FULL_43_9]HAZ16643.1 hypothetical protein [Candidatus Jacksonbacteria bacter
MIKIILKKGEGGKGEGKGKEMLKRVLKISKEEVIRSIFKEVFIVYTIAVVLLLLSEDIKYGFVSFYIKTNYLIFIWGILFVVFLAVWDKKIDSRT